MVLEEEKERAKKEEEVHGEVPRMRVELVDEVMDFGTLAVVPQVLGP